MYLPMFLTALMMSTCVVTAVKSKQLTADQLKEQHQLKQLSSLSADLKLVTAEMKTFAKHTDEQSREVSTSWQTLRSDLDTLSREMAVMRQQKQEEAAARERISSQNTIILWLQDMVGMLREQLTDLSESFSLSDWQQTSKRISAEMNTLQKESDDRKQLVLDLQSRERTTSDLISQLHAEINSYKSKIEEKDKQESLIQKELNEIRKEMKYLRSQRHHHHHRSSHRSARAHGHKGHPRGGHHGSEASGNIHLHALDNIIDVLFSKQETINERLVTIEKTVSSVKNHQVAELKEQREQSEKIEDLRREQRLISWKLNTSSSAETLSKLQASSVRLIREMDAVEQKFDGELLHVKSELARLDVACGQMNSSLMAIHDEAARLPQVTLQLRQEIAEISSAEKRNHANLLAMQGDVINRKLQCCLHSTDGSSVAD